MPAGWPVAGAVRRAVHASGTAGPTADEPAPLRGTRPPAAGPRPAPRAARDRRSRVVRGRPTAGHRRTPPAVVSARRPHAKQPQPTTTPTPTQTTDPRARAEPRATPRTRAPSR